MAKVLKKYGIPYMGSKQKILKNICGLFPKADHFYDLFGGGFSVNQFMYEHRNKDYKEFHYNEIRSGVPKLIQDAIAGKYNYNVYRPEFIDRDTFFERIGIDPMIKLLWSFGNNGRTYLFSKEIEPYKKSMHNAIVFNRFDELAKETFKMSKFAEGYTVNQRRLFLGNKIEYYRKNLCLPDCLSVFLKEEQRKLLFGGKSTSDRTPLKQLERLQQLQRLEQLQQLQRLKASQKLNFHNSDYRDVKIKPNSVIYCDIPYIGTADYGGSFNHKEFYDWANSQKNPVFISEYTLDDDRFESIFSIKKRNLLAQSDKSSLVKTERVFANKAGVEAFYGK